MTDATTPPAGSDERDGPERLTELSRPAPVPSWTERLARVGDAFGLHVTPMRSLAIGAAVLGLAIVAFVVLRPSPAVLPEASVPFAEPTEESTPSESSSTTGPSSVLVHAAGGVQAPGVYELPVGSRVADLVAAAGGAAGDADLNRVNLAAPVEDGQQVYVPRVGEAVPAGGAGESTAVEGDGRSTGPIDVNTAPADVLDELPGVGPAIAQAIITYREEHGPFGSVDELLEVPGIGDAKLAQLRDLIAV